MSSLMLIGNPRRRRKARKARSRRRGHRKMTAKQLKYFGPRRARRAAPAKRRRSRRSVIVARANPVRRRSRRSYAGRRFRRNPIGGAQVRASLGSVMGVAKNAAVGAAGAIAVDAVMAQAARFMPASMSARYDAQGNMNWGYYAAKGAIAVGVGVLGAKFLPGSLKRFAARSTEGSFTVMAYEIMRSVIPANMLGFYSPARTAGTVGRMGRMGAYLPRPASGGGMGRLGYAGNAGTIGGSVRNFEGYTL